MPTDQQTLFPLRTELAGRLESVRVSRVKTLRKNVISMSYFPHPLKDDKLLLDEKIKWLSLSNFGAVSCQRSSPWRMGTSEVLLCIFKVFTPVLETGNILMGLLMLPFAPDSPSNPKERESCWFTGMEKSTQILICSCPGRAALQWDPCWAACLGMKDMAWAEALRGLKARKLGSALSHGVLQNTGRPVHRVLNWETETGVLSLPQESHRGLARLPFPHPSNNVILRHYKGIL